jgi:hypothetical protein
MRQRSAPPRWSATSSASSRGSPAAPRIGTCWRRQ